MGEEYLRPDLPVTQTLPSEPIRVTVEQRCTAAQALWVACNRMLDAKDARAVEWWNDNRYSEMRYRCRCKRNVEAFYEAWAMVPQHTYETLEDFAWDFLHVCISRHSMNVHREWRTYWEKELKRICGTTTT